MRSVLVMILISCMALMVGCGKRTNSQSKEENMFVCIQKADGFDSYDVVYHRDTKVMYAVSHGAYNIGTFTLLVNPDGTPMLYEDDKEGK